MEDTVGEKYSTHGRHKKCMQNINQKALKEETTWKSQM